MGGYGCRSQNGPLTGAWAKNSVEQIEIHKVVVEFMLISAIQNNTCNVFKWNEKSL